MATHKPQPIQRDAIVEAALRVADAEGLAAVSMRRVGAELGIAAMSLYHHVASKEALLNLIADDAIGQLPSSIPVPRGSGSSRASSRRSASSICATRRSHGSWSTGR